MRACGYTNCLQQRAAIFHLHSVVLGSKNSDLSCLHALVLGTIYRTISEILLILFGSHWLVELDPDLRKRNGIWTYTCASMAER